MIKSTVVEAGTLRLWRWETCRVVSNVKVAGLQRGGKSWIISSTS